MSTMRPVPAPCASVVIPVKDGAATLGALLDALAVQQVPLEVLVLDSASRDGSGALAAARGARVVPVAPGAFDHGETRNLGAREAQGPFVLFFTQDALPQGPSFVQALLAPLQADGRLAGAFARQVPRPDADPLTRRDIEACPAGSTDPRTALVGDPTQLDRLDPLARHHATAFDDVASAVRRDVLLAHPFVRTRFGEDAEWGLRMVRLGFGIAYVPEAVVVHSHPRRAGALFRRNYLAHRLLFRLFGLRTVPDRRHLARALAGALVSDLGTLAGGGARLGDWLAAPVQAIAATYGQYRGARDEQLGRPYPDWA